MMTHHGAGSVPAHGGAAVKVGAMELKATEQRYELSDESGYVFEVVATFDPEWGWAASVVMTKRGMRTAEAAIEGLGSLAAQFLRMLNGDEEGERDRLRAQVEGTQKLFRDLEESSQAVIAELRAQVEDAQNETRRERRQSSDAIKLANATIAEQARRIEELTASTITMENHTECCDERARQAEAPLKQALRDAHEAIDRDSDPERAFDILDAALKEQAPPGEVCEHAEWSECPRCAAPGEGVE